MNHKIYTQDDFFEWVIDQWLDRGDFVYYAYDIKDMSMNDQEWCHCICGQSRDEHNMFLQLPGTNFVVSLGMDCYKRFTDQEHKTLNKSVINYIQEQKRGLKVLNCDIICKTITKNSGIYKELERNGSNHIYDEFLKWKNRNKITRKVF